MDQLNNRLLAKVKSYKMPPAAAELLTKHRPLIVAGTTAAGKNAVMQVIQEDGHGTKVVTHTTRTPRSGEKNGVDYWFVTEARMLELIEEESFIEVKGIHDFIYGTSIMAYQTVIDEGQQPLLVVDVQGTEEIVRQVSNLRVAFLLPPDFETWMRRLDGRGEMSHVERQRRLESAKAELEIALRQDHFMLVINHDTRQAAKEVVDGRTDASTQSSNRELAQRLIDHINAF